MAEPYDFFSANPLDGFGDSQFGTNLFYVKGEDGSSPQCCPEDVAYFLDGFVPAADAADATQNPYAALAPDVAESLLYEAPVATSVPSPDDAQVMPASPPEFHHYAVPSYLRSPVSSTSTRDSSPEVLAPPPAPRPPMKGQPRPFFTDPSNPFKRKRSVKSTITKEEIMELATKGLPPQLVKDHLTEEEERDLKRQRRLIKNRESAQNSRLRRKEYMSTIEQQANVFAQENERLKQRVLELENQNRQMADELRHLRGTTAGTVSSIVSRVVDAAVKIPVSSTPTKAVCLMIVLFSFGVLFKSSGAAIPMERTPVLPSPGHNRLYVGRVLQEAAIKEEYATAHEATAASTIAGGAPATTTTATRARPSRVHRREAPLSVIDVQKRNMRMTKDDIMHELEGQPYALEAVKHLQAMIDAAAANIASAASVAIGGKPAPRTPTPQASAPPPTVAEGATNLTTTTNENSRRHAMVMDDGAPNNMSTRRSPDAYVYCPTAQAVMSETSFANGELPIMSFLIPSSALGNQTRTMDDGDTGPLLQLNLQLLDMNIIPSGAPAAKSAAMHKEGTTVVY